MTEANSKVIAPAMQSKKHSTKKLTTSEFIWCLEKRITRLLRKYKYEPEIDFAGKTECYSVVTKPILKLLDEFNSAKQIQLLA